jgi:hypothetical protein
LGIFLHEIGKKRALFTLGLEPIFGPQNAVAKSLKVKRHDGDSKDILENVFVIWYRDSHKNN